MQHRTQLEMLAGHSTNWPGPVSSRTGCPCSQRRSCTTNRIQNPVKGFRTSGSRHVRGLQTILDLFPGFSRAPGTQVQAMEYRIGGHRVPLAVRDLTLPGLRP
ncbi:hypothetical protein JRQ81_008985 [Phrynocephalus forsythii]|uniref:Uncharacterized protein n=1 Tax=Phrynocephalus forsythii TaxID=171643 RepID=A0A9Q1ASS9_9SAUR|nr:hypothetical protein JRQ81_008985 [Phrynocephalus forsythii]